MDYYGNNSYVNLKGLKDLMEIQTEQELRPIITATKRAGLEAQQSIAEYQGNMVKSQLKAEAKKDHEDLKDTYMSNLTKIGQINDPKHPMRVYLEAENASILAQLQNK